jgi:hypothetical protein
MANGYYPTGRYDLSTSGDKYTKEKELSENENGFDKVDVLESYLPWEVEYDKFDEHLETAPEYAIFKEDLNYVKGIVTKRVNSPKSVADPTVAARKKSTEQKTKNLNDSAEKNIPTKELGPIGKPKIHTVSKPNNKSSKDAAGANNPRANSKPVKHSSDKGQKTH